MNQLIVDAVRDRLGGAQDNLHRAESAFRNCTAEQMQQQYGASGETRAQIVDGYRDSVRRWKQALADAEAMP